MRFIARLRILRCAATAIAIAFAGAGCMGGGSDSSSATTSVATGYRTTTARTCAGSLTASQWTPDMAVIGSDGLHDATVEHSSETKSASGKLTGFDQSWSSSSHQMQVQFTIGAGGLGAAGSVSLVARLSAYPNALTGYGWPALVSLTGPAPNGGAGTVEWVKLASACQSGFFSSPWTIRSGCAPSAGSAFLGSTSTERMSRWEESHRLAAGSDGSWSGEFSVTSFPTCNWSGGTPSCPFQPGTFLNADGTLPEGTYTATYVVVTNYYGSSIGDSYDAGVEVTIGQKEDATASGGTLDVNVVLVGDQNIADSKTAKGQINLDLLMKEVQRIYGTENSGTSGMKLGEIKAYEWPASQYADLDISSLGSFFSAGSTYLSCTSGASASEGKAVNVFLVSSFLDGGAATGILGIAGGIPGVMLNGTQGSGVVFATMDGLATYNSSALCNAAATCTRSVQDASFVDMGSTISHEVGHFLGLWHLSESGGTSHDPIADTPKCSNTTGGYITRTSCLNLAAEPTCNANCAANPDSGYCPAASSCSFNHVMWWSSKAISSTDRDKGDGNLFSASSGGILNYSPYVR